MKWSDICIVFLRMLTIFSFLFQNKNIKEMQFYYLYIWYITHVLLMLRLKRFECFLKLDFF